AELLESGPSYVPHDESPRTVWDADSQAMLTRTLLPVLRRDGLPARIQARLWLLIRSDGTVADAVLQTSSGHEAFDEAAGEVARRLRFVPARRAGQPVATWVVRAISLLMQ
ncbi:MAG: energy transducer TonB, partial [Gemmatimonadota bacterium]